jgi:hypothetical protein
MYISLTRFFPRSARGVAVVLGLFLGALFSASPAGAHEAEPFGLASFTIQATAATRLVPLAGDNEEVVNEPYTFTQAGGHPWALTTTFEVDTQEEERNGYHGTQRTKVIAPTRDPKDVIVSLPAGLLGDPLAVPRCPLTVVLDSTVGCPASSQIGMYNLRLFGGHRLLGPIVNVIPEAGQSAEFALENSFHVTALLTAHLVRTPQGYSFTVADNGIPSVELSRVELTFWGVPADPSHDAMRGLVCKAGGTEATDPSGVQCEKGDFPGGESGVAPVPFLSLGSDCAGGPEVATIRADSWEEPGRVGVNQQYEGYAERAYPFSGVTGCNLLAFDPSVEVQPDTLLADEPVGVGVDIRVPQPESPGRLATPHLRDAVVTLPEGMSVSPGIVDGIEACNESGPEGIDFTGPESEEEGLNGELQLAAGHCPDASTVGTAEAVTPLLSEPVKGHVYLARPLCGGAGQAACTEEDALDGRLYELYLELGGVGALGDTGIHIKVPGYVEANPATGQLTTKFLEDPQVPFSELRVDLNGGPRAPIDNPAVCGRAVTTADFTPWSAPGVTPEGLSMAGTPEATPSSFFEVGGCAAGGAPLNPGFTAGTVTPQAGQFSAFTLNLSRQDREQFLKGIQVHTPPGLLGMLASVQLCGEPEADNGHCPQSSKIGTTRVATGAGSHPFEIEGSVYLTGPHDGAPFGLSIVTPAVAGPFNLGLVVVRARIDVDPMNSTLTVTTDETGPYALPQIIFGIPLRLQRVTVDIDRPDFMFNPTNCAQQQVTVVISGSENARAAVSSPFAVGGCKSLAFKPKFAVSTSGKTSKADGASLDAKLSYPAGAMGNEANIARVKVELPKQLPSRLTTLQKACPAATFEANPANCAAAAIVGIVRASTPLLPVGLSGPAYFVSHGGEAFPSLIAVLQGDGVRVDLTGSTFINKAGITSSTFKTVPDVPVNTFEIYLPEGRYSALAATGNLCDAKLTMPTTFLAQNGAEVHQRTPISVTGCPKAKAIKPRKTRKTARGRK